MPVELRKRKAHQLPTAAAQPATKKTPASRTATKAKTVAAKESVDAPATKEEVKKKPAQDNKKKPVEDKKKKKPVEEKEDENEEEEVVASKAGDDKKSDSDKKSSELSKGGDDIKVGDLIDLDTFGGEVETHDGEKVTLKQLLSKSEKGVVLFTYPKASTPGCTKQVCFFRDSHTPITSAGLSIYGLSADSPKANTTFATKQSLQYQLLCDPAQTLIAAIGLKKSPRGTQRGVFVVDKRGEVLVAEAGSPAGTHERVLGMLDDLK